MRLDKYLAHSGFGSRTEVKKYIKKGQVTVNDVVVKKDNFHVDDENDFVVVDGFEVVHNKFVYLMMNKPVGYVCANTDRTYPTVIDLVSEFSHLDIFCVGRLDVDTTGLLLITNDGQFAHRLINSKFKVPKVYHAYVEGFINECDILDFASGKLALDDKLLKPAILKEIERNETHSWIEITLYEGRYHQVKRMVHLIGKEVEILNRVRIKDLNLDEALETGEYRMLSEIEIEDLIS